MSLDSLRKLRAQTEEAITMELAQIAQQLIQLEEQSQVLSAQIQSDAVTYRVQTEQGLAIEYVLEWQARMDAQQAALARAYQAIGTLTEAWNHTQGRLIEASQERKVLDRLAERRQQAHVTDTKRREQRTSDEAAYRQHAATGKLAS